MFIILNISILGFIYRGDLHVSMLQESNVRIIRINHFLIFHIFPNNSLKCSVVNWVHLPYNDKIKQIFWFFSTNFILLNHQISKILNFKKKTLKSAKHFSPEFSCFFWKLKQHFFRGLNQANLKVFSKTIDKICSKS